MHFINVLLTYLLTKAKQSNAVGKAQTIAVACLYAPTLTDIFTTWQQKSFEQQDRDYWKVRQQVSK